MDFSLIIHKDGSTSATFMLDDISQYSLYGGKNFTHEISLRCETIDDLKMLAVDLEVAAGMVRDAVKNPRRYKHQNRRGKGKLVDLF